MARGGPAGRQGSGRRWRSGLLWPWAAAGVAALAVAAVAAALWAGAAPNDGETVSGFMHIHGLEIPAWAPDDVFISTHQGLIRVDSRGAWRMVSDEPHDFMGFRAHPTETGVLYSSGHPAFGSGLRNPVGFTISRDEGTTWRPVALEGEADFHAMAVYPGDGETIYGWNVAGAAGLYRSTDGGSTWERRSAPGLAGAGGPLSLAVHPDDPGHVLAGTPDGLWRTRDGGASWEQALAGPVVTAVAFRHAVPEQVMVYGAGTGDGLFVIEDGSDSRTSLNLVLPGNDAVFHIAIHPEDEQTIYAGTLSESLFKTTDGGQTWRQLAERGVPLSREP